MHVQVRRHGSPGATKVLVTLNNFAPWCRNGYASLFVVRSCGNVKVWPFGLKAGKADNPLNVPKPTTTSLLTLLRCYIPVINIFMIVCCGKRYTSLSSKLLCCEL